MAPADIALQELVSRLGRRTKRPTRPLHLQALLQLPRIADNRGWLGMTEAEDVLSDLAAELPPTPAWLVPDVGSSPRSLKFHPVELSALTDAMRRYHYLRSPREDGRAYALSTEGGATVAFCVSSPMDVPQLERLLHPAGIPTTAQSRVVSRVFAFESAPRNTISYLLARAAEQERNLGITELVTYVNPNMGFAGTSYRASGWLLVGDEPGTKYRYLDERYITDRALRMRFGEKRDREYMGLLGHRFEVSRMQLKPLHVFHRHLD